MAARTEPHPRFCGRRILASRDTLAKESTWTSSTDTVFDGTYRYILRAARAKSRQEA